MKTDFDPFKLSIFSQIYLDIDFADDRCDILP
jgi:hypothetical protein